jgi:hypothetical protein
MLPPAMRVLVFTCALAAAACATTRIRILAREGAPLAARSVVVLPLQHRFPSAPHRAFARAIPLCEAILDRGGFYVVGPDEVALEPRLLGARLVFAARPVQEAVRRAGLDPASVVILRAWAEERVAKTAAALFNRAGAARAARRQVEVVLRVGVEIVAPPAGEIVASGVAEAAEDPFADVPDHDRRPLVVRLVRKIAPAVLRAAAARLRAPPGAPGPLGLKTLASAAVLEGFRLGGGGSLADRFARDPLLGRALRDVHRRALAEDVSDPELRALDRAPPGVLVRTARAGLASRDVVLAVADEPVRTPWALHRLLYRAPAGATIEVWRDGRRLRLPLASAGVERREGAAAEGAGSEGLAEVDVEEAVAVRAAAAGEDVAEARVERLPERVELAQRIHLDGDLRRPGAGEDLVPRLGIRSRPLPEVRRPRRREDLDLLGAVRTAHRSPPPSPGGYDLCIPQTTFPCKRAFARAGRVPSMDTRV